MSYCDLDTDVLALIPKVQALRDAEPGGLPVTQPTRSQAESLRAQVEAEIDGHLRRRGVALPVTDLEALSTLLPIAAAGTAAAVMRAAFPQDEGVGGAGGAATKLEDKYQGMLAALDAGLLDADTTSEGCNVSHGFRRWHHPLADEMRR
jgi:hypothetical protein